MQAKKKREEEQMTLYRNFRQALLTSPSSRRMSCALSIYVRYICIQESNIVIATCVSFERLHGRQGLTLKGAITWQNL